MFGLDGPRVPPRSGKPARLVILCHGYGSNGEDLIGLAPYFAKAVPAVLIMLLMPLGFSIAEGMAVGFVVYVGFMLGCGRGREVTPLAYGLGALFLAHLIWK